MGNCCTNGLVSDSGYNSGPYCSIVDFSFSVEGKDSSKILVIALFTAKEDGTPDVKIGQAPLNSPDSKVPWNKKVPAELIVRVYDLDHLSTPPERLGFCNQHLVEYVLSSSKIVQKPNQTHTFPEHEEIGVLTIHTQETQVSSSIVVIKFRCTPHKNIGNDHFLEISRHGQSSIRTRRLVKNIGYAYIPILENLSKDEEFCIKGFNKSNNTQSGQWQASISYMEGLCGEKTAINPSRGHEKVKLYVDSLEILSIFDYMGSHHKLHLMFAIDFADTNKDPEIRDSLHHIDDSGKLNVYQQVIKVVGDAIGKHCEKQHFVAWCFGGKRRDGKNTSSCFSLKSDDGPAIGVDGMNDAYISSFKEVILNRRCCFSEVINKAYNYVGLDCDDSSKYNVLLIITNGDLQNVSAMKDSLVKASDKPLSILIVGVGKDKKFSTMEKLCADEGKPLKNSQGKVAKRRILHFVHHFPGNEKDMVEVLYQEIVWQYLNYMQMKD